MPKILLVANTDWYLFNFRLSLAEYLRAQGYEVGLVSPVGEYSSKLTEAGFDWHPWHVGRQTTAPWSEAVSLFKLTRIYLKYKPDLVHHFTAKPVLYGSISARLARVKFVVNAITGLGYLFLREEAKARLLRRVVKYFFHLGLNRGQGAVIFENETDRQFFISEGLVNAERTCLIEGVGVDPERFHPHPEPEGYPIVILPARMLWDKGVGVLVEAARALKQEGVQARFVLVGEPDPGNPASIDDQTIQEWVEEKLVEWWGWQQDMSKVYSASSIVVLPSFGEGVPTVLLEAAASGRAIVTTDVPGCRDVVEHGVNGLLAPPHDEQALAQALGELIANPDMRVKMGAAGRQRVLERYTNSKINAATEGLYKKLLVSV
jgi:glycosyltransferase involved in cell wall biosynthesis